jgi:hypothetical protein
MASGVGLSVRGVDYQSGGDRRETIVHGPTTAAAIWLFSNWCRREAACYPLAPPPRGGVP